MQLFFYYILFRLSKQPIAGAVQPKTRTQKRNEFRKAQKEKALASNDVDTLKKISAKKTLKKKQQRQGKNKLLF